MDKKCKISACLIVKDEGKNMKRCLSGLKGLADEIIVTDTGSTDDTVEIAKKNGALISYYRWDDDFSAARNFCLKKATGDWIIWLDADDVIKHKDAARIRKLAEAAPAHVDGFMLPYFLSVNKNGKPTKYIYRLRIFRNGKNIHFRYPVHEILNVKNLTTGYHHSAGIYHRPRKDKKHTSRNIDIILKSLCNPAFKNDVHLMFHLGKEYQYLGYTDHAVAIYKKCLNHASSSSQKYIFNNRIASCLEAEGTYNQMLMHSFRALEADPTLPDPYYKISKYFGSIKQTGSAAFWVKMAKNLPKKTSPDVIRVKY